jgi:D-alanyl-lipoteichoic acid acyltransferase DltB (MBOAT superfamily)
MFYPVLSLLPDCRKIVVLTAGLLLQESLADEGAWEYWRTLLIDSPILYYGALLERFWAPAYRLKFSEGIGPINRFPEFLRDERRKRWDSKLFYSGLERVLFGYFKVVVLANYLLDTKLQVHIEQVGGNDTAYGAWLGCVEYGLDLYFRFGGYCDIAIRLAALLGFRILENFNYPFMRSNINTFWKSWHISLSSWCRDYVFTPVAYLLKRPTPTS